MVCHKVVTCSWVCITNISFLVSIFDLCLYWSVNWACSNLVPALISVYACRILQGNLQTAILQKPLCMIFSTLVLPPGWLCLCSCPPPVLLPVCFLLDAVRGHHAIPHAGCGLQHSVQEMVDVSADWLGYGCGSIACHASGPTAYWWGIAELSLWILIIHWSLTGMVALLCDE